MKTIDELLKGTKYKLSGYSGSEELSDCQRILCNAELRRMLEHDAAKNAALASLLPAAVKALEYYANPDTHWRSGFMPKTFEATGADAGEMARSTLTAISEATKAVEGN